MSCRHRLKRKQLYWPEKTPNIEYFHSVVLQGVLLFGFKEEEESVVRRWLAEVEASLPVLAFRPSEGNGLVDTVEAALAQIEQANSETLTQDIIEYLAEGYPPLPGPVVLFSGLVGEEVVGLLEAWQSFTG